MRCPKDADSTDINNRCTKVNFATGWICTRPKGHKGKHHCHSSINNRCILSWE